MQPAHRFLATALALSLALATSANAGDVLFTSEVMFEEQGLNSLILGYYFGADASSPLSFTSFVDPSGNSFNYATVPGSTYRGLNLSLTGFGTSNASGNIFAVSATINIGKTVIQIEGDETREGNGDTLESDKDESENGKKIGDTHYTGTLTEDHTGMKSTSTGYKTNAEGKIIPKSDFKGTDEFDFKTQTWNWATFPLFVDPNAPPFVSAQGFTPTVGGDGTSTVTISGVPEPPTITLAVLGMLVRLAYTRLRRPPMLGRPLRMAS